MTVLHISCSLSPGSRSRVLAAEAARALEAAGAGVKVLDLRDFPMPMCDGEDCEDPNVARLAQAVGAADAILLAVPIYSYDVNAAAKNLVEHTGSAWEGKVVGFLCAAGGTASYMSVMGLANSLMLDFRCLIVPRFVYATAGDFSGGEVSSARIKERVAQLASHTVRLAKALRAT